MLASMSPDLFPKFSISRVVSLCNFFIVSISIFRSWIVLFNSFICLVVFSCNSLSHIIIKTPNVLNKERILKAVRGKGQVTYKGRPIRITPDFSPETMKARRSWADVIQTLREQKCQSRLLIPNKTLNHHRRKKRRYSMTTPNLHNIFPQIQPYKG